MRQLARQLKLALICLSASMVLSAFLPAQTVLAEKPCTSCSPKEIHPIYWKATLRGTVRVKILETKKKVTIPYGTQVIVTKYKLKGKNTCMLKNGTHFRVPLSNLSIYEHACTPGDFTKKTKTAFVNSRTLRSKTGWLIWVSTDRQSLNIFRGSNRKWVFYKKFNCSTGMANWSTPLGRRKIRQKIRSQYSEEFDSWLNYFLEFGGSGIHQWPGPNPSQYMGKEPCSHACIRLYRMNAIWCYKHIPVGTTLYVY